MQGLSTEQLLALLKAARAKRERDYLMILVAYWHGLRASEVVGLTVNSVAGGELTVQRLKGSKKTSQPLFSHPIELLDEKKAVFDYTRGMTGNQKLFDITRERFWQIVQEHGKTAGIPKRLCHPHAMKHTIGFQVTKKAGIHVAKQHLGHESGASTMEYAQMDDSEASAEVKTALGAR